MEIIFINREEEIVKIGENVKIEVIGEHLVGMNIEQKIMEIENYGSEEEAKEEMEGIIERMSRELSRERTRTILIDLRKERRR